MKEIMISIPETTFRRLISVLEDHIADSDITILNSLKEYLPKDPIIRMDLKGIFNLLDQERVSDIQAEAGIAWLMDPNNGLDGRLVQRASEKIKKKIDVSSGGC